ncbi:type 2 lanthipeptide synthetase LanM [Marivita sp. GX14005]|uniref:type 2 lanthipeptide synthetase LanM n=1 Tax=Marivita sp. GX14005 TaxID=2942276 RepID=UPI0020191795|nr:type 2 lanthipeptide synthetase LanM [Marivita sp. GX14005]MCL3882223.1 type 2 lanthipeptide synthetase LanM [Marivita sp. GX14005]
MDMRPAVLSLREAERLACTPVLGPVFAEHLAEEERTLEAALGRFAPERIDHAQIKRDALDWLQVILGRLTNEFVFERFAAFRAVHDRFWRPGVSTGPARRTLVNSFSSSSFWRDCLDDSGTPTPLGRLLASLTENWRSAVMETVERLDMHRKEAAAIISPGATDPGRLETLEFGLSDLHCHGRSVAIARFALGSVVYKPRDITTEQVWNDTFAYVLQRTFGGTTDMPRVARMAGFGLVEHIRPAPCETESDVEDCYRRFGAIAALAHGLGATDLHHENIIVREAVPYVIDAETMLPASLRPRDEAVCHAAHSLNAPLRTFPSIYASGLLPVRVAQRRAASGSQKSAESEHTMGGLAPFGLEAINVLVPVNPDTDELSYAACPACERRVSNLPFRVGRTVLPVDKVGFVVEGFARAYDTVLKEKDAIRDRVAAGLDTAPIRLVPRPTRMYAAVIARSLCAETLASPSRRRAAIRSDLSSASRAEIDVDNTLLETEVAQVLHADVPYFALGIRESMIDGAELGATPLRQMSDRLGELGDDDKVLQTATLGLSVGAEANIVDSPQPEADPRLRRLNTLLRVISEAAQYDASGLWWPQVTNDEGRPGTRAHRDREALYDGSAGTAIVLAEVGRILGRSELCEMARAALLYPGCGELAAERGPGLARGLGGFCFALLRAGTALQDDAMIARAFDLLHRHAPRMVGSDSPSDLMFGRAGLLMALLAAEAAEPGPGLRAIADGVARNLIADKVDGPEGCFWPGGTGRPALHAAHGATGIAVALARWTALRGDGSSLDTVRAALSADDRFWRDHLNGWQHVPNIEPPAAGWSWCGGRAGAVSARSLVWNLVGHPFDIERAYRAASAEAGGSLVRPALGLCCGTSGILDALLTGARALSGGATRELQARMVQRAGEAEEILIGSTALGKVNPLFTTLFSGGGGAAGALARSLWPDRIGSLVWFE